MKRLKYLWLVIVWQIKHIDEPNNRQKWRRMEREVTKCKK